MELYIDTTNKNDINLQINNEKTTISVEFNQAEKLLPFVKEFLRKNNVVLKDVTSIKVNNSGSSFTSLRNGVITANVLGYALGIKVKSTKKNRKSHLLNKNFDIISPIYDKEPNITVKN